MFIFKGKIHNVGHLVSGTSILPLTDKIEALMKLKLPTNIKEIRHFLGLTGYYRKVICNHADRAYPLNCLTRKSQPFIWTPDCQSSFHMVHSHLANTPIVELPDSNKPYLLLMGASKYCYSGVLNQGPTDESNEALVQLLSENDPLTSIYSQTQDFKLNKIWFTLKHISQAASLKASAGGLQSLMNLLVSLCLSKNAPFIYKILIY